MPPTRGNAQEQQLKKPAAASAHAANKKKKKEIWRRLVWGRQVSDRQPKKQQQQHQKAKAQWRHAHGWERDGGRGREHIHTHTHTKERERERMNNNERGGGCVGPFYFLGKSRLPRSHAYTQAEQHKPFLLLKTTWRGVEYHHTH